MTRRPVPGGHDAVSDRDVVEAEYETVVGRYHKLDRAIAETAARDPSNFNLDILSGDDGAEQDGRAGPAYWAVSALLVAAAFWISGGYTLMPANGFRTTAEHSNPLAIEDVRSSIENRNARSFLLVDGSVTNGGTETLPLPDLIIQVKLADGSITRYRIAGGAEKIIAGGRYVFSSKLSAPEEGVENVKVIMQGAN